MPHAVRNVKIADISGSVSNFMRSVPRHQLQSMLTNLTSTTVTLSLLEAVEISLARGDAAGAAVQRLFSDTVRWTSQKCRAAQLPRSDYSLLLNCPHQRGP